MASSQWTDVLRDIGTANTAPWAAALAALEEGSDAVIPA